jgi:hypothetical protein
MVRRSTFGAPRVQVFPCRSILITHAIVMAARTCRINLSALRKQREVVSPTFGAWVVIASHFDGQDLT